MPTPFVPAPNMVRTSLVFLLDGQIVVNTFNFRFNTQPTIIEMGNLNTAMQTWYNASYKPVCPSSAVLNQINTIGLWSQSAPGVLLPVSPGIAGTSTPALPANGTYCSSIRTLSRGRNFRGRSYLPGLPQTALSGISSVTSGFAGNIQTAIAQLMTPANVANFAFVIISRWLNNVARGTALDTLVTAITGDLTTDSQRRRLPGRGS
jgi:hypothetical protein